MALFSARAFPEGYKIPTPPPDTSYLVVVEENGQYKWLAVFPDGSTAVVAGDSVTVEEERLLLEKGVIFVQTIEELASIERLLIEGKLAVVYANNAEKFIFYRFTTTSDLEPDGVSVVVSPSGGKWIRQMAISDYVTVSQFNIHLSDNSNPHLVTKDQVGLGNVPNVDATNPLNINQTSDYRFVTDSEKAYWNSKQDALGYTPENVANKGQPGGYASLDGGGKIPVTQLPSIAVTSTYVVADILERDGLAVQEGDVAIVQSESKSYIYDGLAWQELLTPPDSVTSVNGQTGTVNLGISDIPNLQVSLDGKVDKPSTSTPGNIAVFTTGNNIIDAGSKPSDYALVGHTHDGRYVSHSYAEASVAGAGWYTIGAVGSKAYGRFHVYITDGGTHDYVVIEAGIAYSRKPYVNIISASSYGTGMRISQARIKYGGTYDGAVLQVYVSGAYNCRVILSPSSNYLDGSNRWIVKSFISDSTDPGDVSNYSVLTNILSTPAISTSASVLSTPMFIGNAVRINPDNNVSLKPDILLNQNGLIAVDTGYTFYLGGSVFSFRNGTTSTATELGKLDSTGMYAADFIQTSDIRLKEDITDLPNELTIDNLRPVRYRLKSTGEYKYGFIAQEVEKVIPEIVFENDEGYKQFSNSSIIPILVKEIKKLKQELKELKDGSSDN